MNIDKVFEIIEDADINDKIEIFIFNKPIEFNKKEFVMEVCKTTNTIEILSKKGIINKTIIDAKDIKYIKTIEPMNIGMDPRDM